MRGGRAAGTQAFMHATHLVGARTHNLKDVSLDLVEGELVCFTGISGAGKSSLAIDTLYAEGLRRFVESFSPYARQFLERRARPPVDTLDPVAAAIAVDRRAPVKSARSSVATLADVEAYLSALFTREAVPICPDCSLEAKRTDPHVAAARAIEQAPGQRAIVCFPVRIAGTAQYLEAREKLLAQGRHRIVTPAGVVELESAKPSEALDASGVLNVAVDRVVLEEKAVSRLAAALEDAWAQADGEASVLVDDQVIALRQGLSCPSCAQVFEPARPGLFSYQSPVGACPECRGFGRTLGIDWDKVLPDPTLSLSQGAIRPWTGKSSEWERAMLADFARRKRIPLTKPWGELTEEQRELVLEGEGSYSEDTYPGVRRWFAWLETRTYKMHVRVLLSRYRASSLCEACGGARLNPDALAYRVGGLDLGAWHALELSDACERLRTLQTSTGQGELARRELATRLEYLVHVGLGYLTLDRPARTLSGGEAQRVSLTAALGSSLTGALFVLDEPTVGLHPHDVPPLVEAMRGLARGNAVVVVEHDPIVVRASDRVVELGPGAGEHGGNICFDGTPEALELRPDLPTGRALSTDKKTPRKPRRSTRSLVVKGARENNLQNIDVSVPLDVLCVVTGPSGSGKSTLIKEVIYRTLARRLGGKDIDKPGEHDGIDGEVKRVELVDQSPLGRTSRGNPATYVKAWDRIRALFAAEPLAEIKGFGPSHFSFNVAGGRCEACNGEGSETVEMQFLADVALECPVCQGRRFREEVLEIKHQNFSVFDVLSMTVSQVLENFAGDAALKKSLAPIAALGLGYLPLGQPLSTLSGGEAQRLKLARAMSVKPAGALYIVDEPSAGLHAQDVGQVLEALQDLVKRGASVLVVDHDLDVMRAADWIIDLGPGAGHHGGRLVAEGTPAEVAATDTATGRALSGDVPLIARDAGAPQVSLKPVIEVVRARENNLRDVSTEVPLGKLVVFTGPSGSGKSSLAFDVIFAEGQRRFLETLSPYARQYLPVMPRPDVDRVSGLPPSVALEQRTSRASAQSTVATVTEVAHYLRLLFAKLGTPHCPHDDVAIEPVPAQVLFERLAKMKGTHELHSPAVRSRKGIYLDLFNAASRAGISKAIVDGVEASTDNPPRLTKTKEHDIDLVVFEGRLNEMSRETFDQALAFGDGAVKVDGKLYSTARGCPECGTSVPELDPRWFSFNTQQGRCEACEGTGIKGGPEAFAEGVTKPCRECEGSRLAPIPRAVRLEGQRYHEVVQAPVSRVIERVRSWKFSGNRALIGDVPRTELLRRLEFLERVGLGYLSLDRAASTLSGGEMQRLRLSAQLGAGLTGAMYVLDEPTIGLHPRDTQRLVDNLRALVDTGSTVLVVEHDELMIQSADHVIDLGPTGGRGGGQIVAQGTPEEILASGSLTAQVLSADRRVSPSTRPPAEQWLELTGARTNNLQDVDLKLPIGRMSVVCGVSGSGKSTLVRQVLYPAVRRALKLVAPEPGPHKKLIGADALQRALSVDQSPIGRTPRSVPATFLGIWDDIRRLFAATPEAQVRGFNATRFSFNSSSGGRCTACSGQGSVSHEMSFLPDVVTPCDACMGLRFEPSTLEVRWKGLSIGDVLRLSADEAVEVFATHPRIRRPLECLSDLGVGYLQLGQGSNTLSGGEAQRMKLAVELTAGGHHQPTLYVLDEPTTGLHHADVTRLIAFLNRLVERGDTLVVIEHHPSVIASADYVVELGPEGGDEGGRIVAAGTPVEVAKTRTHTAAVLRETLEPSSKRPRRKS